MLYREIFLKITHINTNKFLMSLIIAIKVVPGSGQQKWVIGKNGELKAYLKSQPEKGLANKELIKMIAHALRIPQDAVHLLSGDKARTKKIKIETPITYEIFLATLGLALPEKQSLLFE